MSDNPKIGFAGLSHLGTVSAVASAAKGFETVGFDLDGARAARCTEGAFAISEPGLEKLAAANRGRLRFSAEAADLGARDVVFAALDVATDDEGMSDLAALDGLIETVMPALRPDATLVILAQVPPGYTRRRAKAGLALHYQVETLIFGRAMERAMEPERFIVGCADPTEPLPAPYRHFLEAFGCPILPMAYESAELAKIAINMCLAGSIGVANTMAELCEKTGADWREIVPALRLDRRIGDHAYLMPGLGLAGGNLERDLATVSRLAAQHGTDAGVVAAWLANSRHRRAWAARTLRENLGTENGGRLVAVWGLAYKENTNSTKNSPALATIAQLGDMRVRVHDPVVPAEGLDHPRLEEATSPLGAAEGADALLIMTPWPDYGAVDVAALAAAMRGRIVIDPYGVLDGGRVREAGMDHYTLGRPALRRA